MRDNKEFRQIRKKFCIFCRDGSEPDFKDSVSLRRFVTDRGKIVARAKSGVCFKHQRQLSNSIKKSRYMALLPFSVVVR